MGMMKRMLEEYQEKHYGELAGEYKKRTGRDPEYDCEGFWQFTEEEFTNRGD